MDIKGATGESSEGNEEHVIGNWRKGNCYIVAESLRELCPAVMWKVELVNDLVRYLAEISKPRIEDAV